MGALLGAIYESLTSVVTKMSWNVFQFYTKKIVKMENLSNLFSWSV